MRVKGDKAYQDYKDGAVDAFHLYELGNYTPEDVTDWMTDEDNAYLVGTSLFLWLISIAVREIELNILEERVLCNVSYHIPLYDQGEYHDLEADEKELVDKDVAFIKANVTLIPVDQLKEVED